MGDTSVTFYSQPCRVSGSRVRSQTRASCLADTYTEHVTPLFTCSLPSPSGGRFSTANPKSDVEWKIYRAKKVRSQLVGNIRLAAVDAHAGCSRQSVACHSQIPGPGAYVASPLPLPQLPSCTLCCGLQPHHGVSDAGTPQMTKLPAGSAVLRNLLFRARWCEATTRRTSAMPSCSSRPRSTRTAPTTAETRLHSPSRCAGRQRWAIACCARD